MSQLLLFLVRCDALSSKMRLYSDLNPLVHMYAYPWVVVLSLLKPFETYLALIFLVLRSLLAQFTWVLMFACGRCIVYLCHVLAVHFFESESGVPIDPELVFMLPGLYCTIHAWLWVCSYVFIFCCLYYGLSLPLMLVLLIIAFIWLCLVLMSFCTLAYELWVTWDHLINYWMWFEFPGCCDYLYHISLVCWPDPLNSLYIHYSVIFYVHAPLYVYICLLYTTANLHCFVEFFCC